jgi:hypothetical protein
MGAKPATGGSFLVGTKHDLADCRAAPDRKVPRRRGITIGCASIPCVPYDGQIRVAGARDRDPAAAADIAASAVIAVPMVHTRESKTQPLTPGFSILDVSFEELRTVL